MTENAWDMVRRQKINVSFTQDKMLTTKCLQWTAVIHFALRLGSSGNLYRQMYCDSEQHSSSLPCCVVKNCRVVQNCSSTCGKRPSWGHPYTIKIILIDYMRCRIFLVLSWSRWHHNDEWVLRFWMVEGVEVCCAWTVEQLKATVSPDW